MRKLIIVAFLVMAALSLSACGKEVATIRNDLDYPVEITVTHDEDKPKKVVGTEYALYIRSDMNIRSAPSIGDESNIIAHGVGSTSHYTVIKFIEFFDEPKIAEEVTGEEEKFYFEYSRGGSYYEEATEENGGYVWYHIPASYVLRNTETNHDLYVWAKAHPNEEFWVAASCSKDQDCVYVEYKPITDL